VACDTAGSFLGSVFEAGFMNKFIVGILVTAGMSLFLAQSSFAASHKHHHRHHHRHHHHAVHR
jgi:hypothetical protein